MLRMTLKQIIDVIDGRIICGDIDKYGDKLITRVSFDSRDVDANTLFLATVGERVDAHSFIKQVLDNQGPAAVSERDDIDYSGDKLIIKVASATRALQQIAAAYRAYIKVPVIAVTGSVGKTTTREMISCALSAEKKVYSTKKNFNSQLGLPVTVCEFDDFKNIAVLELGMSMPGEMSNIASVARPDCAVYTNIGIAHLENLKTRENILNEKLHLTDMMPKNSPVILNHDNDLLSTAELRPDLLKIFYGSSDDCYAYFSEVHYADGCPCFKAHVGPETVDVRLKVYGEHMIYNAIAALTVCSLYGVNLEKAAIKLSEFSGFAHRQQILDCNGIKIIDDSYNASPDSMKAAIDVLSEINTKGRKIAVLADMRELGDDSINIHSEIGEYVKNKRIDIVYTLGELAANIHGDKHFDNRAELDQYIKDNINSGDTILFKGSNGMELYKSVEKILNGE